MGCFQILQVAVPVGGGAAAVDEQVGAADEAASATHEELGQVAYLVSGSRTMGGHALNHTEIAILAGAVQFVVGQRGDDDAGRDALGSTMVYR